jgi:hypothetical protein
VNPDYWQLFSLSDQQDDAHPVAMKGPDGVTWYRTETPYFNLLNIELSGVHGGIAEDGSYCIYLPVKSGDDPRLQSWTRSQIGKPVGEVVDGQLVLAAEVKAEISSVLRFTLTKEEGPPVLKAIQAGGAAPSASQPAGGNPTTRSSAESVEGRWPAGAEPVQLAFVKPGVRLAWMHRAMLMDEQAEAWLKGLGLDAEVMLGVGQPYEPYLRLAILENRAPRPISWPSDLAGKVRIQSSEQALEFVRLFSGADTWYRFPCCGWLEVRRAEDTRASQDGDMQAGEFDRLKLAKPQVVQSGEGYRIARAVARMDDGEPREVWVLDEAVSGEGGYAVRILAKYLLPKPGTVYAGGLRKQ